MLSESTLEALRARTDFRADIVTKAVEAQGVLALEETALRGLIAEHHIVFAVWPDRNGPDEVGVLLIKGLQRLLDLCETQRASALTWTAIPCASGEQAHAMRRSIEAPRVMQ